MQTDVSDSSSSNKAPLHVSLLLATYNREAVLRETLEAFAALRTEGIELGVVVVDNNSTDGTRATVESFQDRLPLRYLFESRPGKNCALNAAIEQIELGSVVVFTDDDVTPERDWLLRIRAAVERHPGCSVWGGRVNVVWPSSTLPGWTDLPYVQSVGFAAHDLGQVEREYDEGKYPFGPNFWIRRTVLDAGFRYDENVGPRPKGRIMGSETLFLRSLAMAGYTIRYVPDAVVGHRIQPQQVSAREMRRRAFRLGRSGPHYRLCRPALLERSRWAWRLLRMSLLARYALVYSVSSAMRWFRSGFMVNLKAIQGVGYNWESLRVEARRSESSASSRGSAPS